MAQARILVLDESPAVRETVAILLGGDYEIQTTGWDEFAANLIDQAWIPALVVAGDNSRARQILDRLPADFRVLWLTDRPDQVNRAGSERLEDSISRRFSPFELRRRVEELIGRIPATPASRASHLLRCPYVPERAENVLREAATTDLPLLLCGEPGVGKRTTARAVHAARGAAQFLTIGGGRIAEFDCAVQPNTRATLYIDRIDHVDDAGLQILLAHLEPGGLFRTEAGARLRVITSLEGDAAALVNRDRLSAELYYRIGILEAALPPLRDRSTDIPLLVERVASDLRAALGLPSSTFTAAALERLSRYLWFGNLAELEAVLARTLSLCRKDVVDAGDLLFEGRNVLGTETPPRVRNQNGPPALRRQDLDLIINELAHEFKNPLVTIKTFAQHLRRLLAEGGDDEQVARLTGAAVDQIDHTLENLLQFTRLDLPALEPLPLHLLLDPLAKDVSDTLELRGTSCKYEPPPPPVLVSVDPAQAAYALGNLSRALTRDLAKRDGPLVIRFEAPSTILFELPRGCDPLGGHLAALLDDGGGSESPLPLGVAIAAAVLSRNGAVVAMQRDAEPNTVTVSFTVATTKEEVVNGNGKAKRTDR